MKKLIDETDFDNLNELTKRWANPQKSNPSPQSDVDENNSKEINENAMKSEIVSKA
jgi:hypothetical protein